MINPTQDLDTKTDSILDNQKRISLISCSHKTDTTENITLNLILQVSYKLNSQPCRNSYVKFRALDLEGVGP